MKRFLAFGCVLVGTAATASLAQAADCGTVTIASMNWQSAEVLANLDKIILTEGYGCEAEMIVGDTVPIVTSMVEKGQPDIGPEIWTDTVPDLVKRGVDQGKIVQAARVLPEGGIHGLWIPKYTADANPEIKTIADALKHPELFPDPEDPTKGAIYNGPQGWSDTVVISQLVKALGAEKRGFNVLSTGSAAGLDGSIVNAFENKKNWMGYYWSPTALMAKYEMVRLAVGEPHDPKEWVRCTAVADCPDPKANEWPKDNIYTLLSSSFSLKASPEVSQYLKKRSWSNETINKLMAWMTDNQATGEEGAKHFLKENADLWTQWVSPDAAKKIDASL